MTEANKDLKLPELSKVMAKEWKELDDEGKQVRQAGCVPGLDLGDS